MEYHKANKIDGEIYKPQWQYFILVTVLACHSGDFSLAIQIVRRGENKGKRKRNIHNIEPVEVSLLLSFFLSFYLTKNKTLNYLTKKNIFKSLSLQKQVPRLLTTGKMKWTQKFLHITLFLMAAFIILLTLALQEVSFFNLEFLKPTNLKASRGDIAPIRLKSKWKPTWKNNPDENSSESLSNEITILTAYFNIGSFIKGSKYNVYTPQKYMRWMNVFGRIKNKLIMYTDDNSTYELFTSLREKFPEQHTKLFLINRTDLWSFQIRDNISAIYKQPGYPKHYPNTVLPEYSCAMHAKFELLANVIKRNYYKTRYFMWLDIGLFRDLRGNFEFGLSPPRDFNESKVAYSHVNNFEQQTYKKIVYNNKVWVGGASNLGRYDVLYTFTQEYLDFVKKSIEMNLMDTDQQIIYGMYVEKRKPITQLQLYKSGWFKLGYRCYKTWLQEEDEKQSAKS